MEKNSQLSINPLLTNSMLKPLITQYRDALLYSLKQYKDVFECDYELNSSQFWLPLYEDYPVTEEMLLKELIYKEYDKIENFDGKANQIYIQKMCNSIKSIERYFSKLRYFIQLK